MNNLFIDFPCLSPINVITTDLTKKEYKTVVDAESEYINNYYRQLNKNLEFNDDIFMIFSFDGKISNVVNVEYSEYEIIPFHITLNSDNHLWCNFMSPNTLLNKIDKSNLRYISYELILDDQIIDKYNFNHSVLFIFDSKLKISYIFDSNGNFNYFDNHQLNSCLELYSELLDYSFIDIRNAIEIKINVDIEINHRSFIKGYCRCWTFFFQYILSNCSNDFQFIEFIDEFCKSDVKLLTEIIKKFTIYLSNIMKSLY